MMGATLVMCSRLNEIRHHLENVTKLLSTLFGGEFFLKMLEKNGIFNFLFFSPMPLFLVGDTVLYGRLLD
jgi:hypothetical protein